MRLFRNCLVASGLAAAMVVAAPQVHAADTVITEEARTHFAAGVALLQDPKAPRYEEAYREFKAAYDASPSYKILGNLGLCAMKIERDAEAIQAYETYLKEAGPEVTDAQRAQVQRDLLTLKEGVLTVTVSSDPPGATIVDSRTPVEGQDIKNSYGKATAPIVLGLRHGHHTITARLQGYIDQQWEFDATESAAPPHVFAMVKPTIAEPLVIHERPIPTSAWVSGSLTLGLAIAGASFGVIALSKHSDYNSLNDGNPADYPQAQKDRSSGQTLNIVTDALLGGAVVGALVTTYFVLSRGTVDRPAYGQTQHAPVARRSPWVPSDLTPMAGSHGAGASAAWLF
jgi:hypothetical protein